MKKCEGCRAMQPDEAKVCKKCGASLEKADNVEKRTLEQAFVAYKNGDTDAFQVVFEETEQYIYACIWKIVGSCVNAQAMVEDIMRATYMELGRCMDEQEDLETFVAWANTIAAKNCFAFMNNNQPNPYWYDIPYGVANQNVGECILPKAIEHDEAMQCKVKQVMDTMLTCMEKFCVIAYYCNDISMEQLEQLTGIARLSIERNLNSVRTKLSDSLKTEDNQAAEGFPVGPWLAKLFKQEAGKIGVQKRVHDRISSAIAGVMLGMPGVLSSGVILTGATLATGSVAVNSTLSGTGLNSIAFSNAGAKANETGKAIPDASMCDVRQVSTKRSKRKQRQTTWKQLISRTD